MATTYTTLLKLAKPTQGELDGSWGTVVNDNITSMVEEAIAGRSVINTWTTNSHTLTTANGTTAESRAAMLSLTDSGDQLGTNAATVVCPALSKIYIVKNAVGQAATLKTASGTGIAIPNGKTMVLFCDGTNVEEAINNFTGALTTAAITASGAVSVDDATDTTSGTTGSIHTDGGLGVAKNLFVATNATVSGTTLMTGVATHGDDVVSDTDSTDDLGTTGVRWANLFVDAITATDQITATGFTGTLDGILGSGTPAAATVTQLTSGGVIVSDTDSTDDLGTTGVRWRALYVDAITATDQITATGFTGTLDGILGSGTPAAATVTTIDASGVATATTFEPDGDTSASDNAAIGYTAAEGLILTGQGSTSDITLKNDADAIVFTVPTGTDDILFPDNAKAMFGASSDLQIYHNGSYSLISDSGTGNLILACQDFSLSNPAVGEYMITAAVNGAVTLYYDNNAKLATSSTGVAITGEATATGFTGTLDGVLGGGTPAAATVTTIDASGVATATTFEPDGDTSAGDNAAMGYTSVLGAILTGQGSTNDVTLVNDADAAVLSIPTGTTNVAITGDITANNFAGRNLIINGDMAIAQRGTSIVTPTNTVYLLDRYKYFISGTTAAVTVTQDSDMPAGHVGFSMKFDCTTADASVAAGDVAGFHYYVEGFDSAHLAAGTAAAKTITISFWVKSPKTGGHGVIVKNGANNRAYPASYTVSVADTWEYKTMTVAMDTSGTWIGATNGIGLGLYFPLIAGSNFTDPADAWVAAECYGINSGVNILDNAANNFYLTELQVEVGTAATEFERIPYEVLLAKCQRYLPMFEFDTTDNMTGFVGQNVSTTVALIGVPFPVKTRVKPTGVTVSGAAHFSLTQAGSGRVASTAVAVQTVSGRLAGALNITVGSGLIAGEATTLWSNSAGAKFYFTGCEL